ncbi:MAG: DUF484 family protein [Hylemonella sp.]
MTANSALHPITEEDIALYLSHNPEFFDRHAELLSSVQLVSPHSRRTVSLQERQAEMLREKIRTLERRVMEIFRHGTENLALSDKLLHWAVKLMLAHQPRDLPQAIAESIRTQFSVPQTAIRVWAVSDQFAQCDFAQDVSEDTRQLAGSLSEPYCGVSDGFEVVRWLPEPGQCASLAMLPLRAATGMEAGASPSATIGLLVLASPDPQRFASTMGTDYLQRIAELASAALSRLR